MQWFHHGGFFPVHYKLLQNHLRTLNIWITVIYLYLIFLSSVQTFANPWCYLAFLRCSILLWMSFSVTEIVLPFQRFLFPKTWCVPMYCVNFTIIARGFWPRSFRFPNLLLQSIRIWDISVFDFLLLTSKTISPVSSVFFRQSMNRKTIPVWVLLLLIHFLFSFF